MREGCPPLRKNGGMVEEYESVLMEDPSTGMNGDTNP